MFEDNKESPSVDGKVKNTSAFEGGFLKGKKFRIVLAEDHEDALALLQIVLKSVSFELFPCRNGREAIEACEKQMPDLAILDVLMPGADGIEVCRWIKQHSGASFIPVILLTCRSELSDRVNGLNCGADDYITKPYALPELEARINALLRIKILTNELKETQSLLAEKEKQLVAAQVAGAAAHELGQPLTSLVLSSELLGKLENSSPKFEQILSAILAQAKRMQLILNQLNKVQEYRTVDYVGDIKILDLGNPKDPNYTNRD